MIDWDRLPWSLRAYALLIGIGAIVVISQAHRAGGLVIFVVVILVWLYFLLRGSRPIWMVSVGISVLGLLIDLAFYSFTVLGFATGIVGLALLLWPSTRRFFSVSGPDPS
jgi:hypothetical protein